MSGREQASPGGLQPPMSYDFLFVLSVEIERFDE